MNNKSYFSKVWKSISGTLISTTNYPYDRSSNNSGVHSNYNVTDTTELRLISSRRTFL